MIRNCLLVITALLALAMPCFAGEEPSAALEEAVRALESPFSAEGATIRDFKAVFLQKSRITSLDRVQEGRGRVAVKFDHASTDRLSATKFRWDYEKPTEQQIVSNGKTMWVYLPENDQVIKSEIDSAATTRADDPLTFLTGLGNLSRDFSISWAEPKRDEKGNFMLDLRPRRPSAMIQHLLIVVDRDAVAGRSSEEGKVFPIVSTTVFDPNGNSTTIHFRETRTNLGLSDSLFNFTIPEGVEVVHPTGSRMGF